MKLSELIAAVGDEYVQFQRLDETLLNADSTKNGTKITFVTQALNPGHVLTGTGPVGLVVWLPRDKLAEALKK
jgi:hypothetical protein